MTSFTWVIIKHFLSYRFVYIFFLYGVLYIEWLVSDLEYGGMG